MAFKIINNDVIRPQKRWGWRVVKGGWRVCDTLHLYKYLCIRHLYRICEGWRVFLKVAFYPPLPEFSIQSSQLRVQENFDVSLYGGSRWLTLSCYSIGVLSSYRRWLRSKEVLKKKILDGAFLYIHKLIKPLLQREYWGSGFFLITNELSRESCIYSTKNKHHFLSFW